MIMKRQLQFGSSSIDFILSWQSRKSLGIKIYPDAGVEVLAPMGSDEAEIMKKVKAKAPWILKQLDHFQAFRPSTPPRKFINGETHLYLGRQYRLRIVPDACNSIKLSSGRLWIHATYTEKEKLEQQLKRWYNQKALLVFEELLLQILPRFKKHKISKPSLMIRTMKKRWGSCTPGGRIILNPELVKASKGSIEYVIVHELCHLVHHSHTKPFFDLQSRMLPDWKKWKERLEYSLA
jgi:predicted metal-dependent hydrolase